MIFLYDVSFNKVKLTNQKLDIHSDGWFEFVHINC